MGRTPSRVQGEIREDALAIIERGLVEFRRCLVEPVAEDGPAHSMEPQGGLRVRARIELPRRRILLVEFARTPSSRLTGRQLEVAWQFVLGSDAADVADQLRISKNTVRNHVRAIYERLEIHRKIELFDYLACHHPEKLLRSVVERRTLEP